MESRSLDATVNFEAKGASHCKVQGLAALSCAKMTEPIEMPFWMLSQVDPREHVLDGGAH